MVEHTDIEMAVAKNLCVGEGLSWPSGVDIFRTHKAQIRIWIKKARRTIAAHTAAIESEDMVIVPRRATKAMIAAARALYEDDEMFTANVDYSRMVEAYKEKK